MDPSLMQKFEAMKISKKSRQQQQQFLDKILVYTFIAITCSIIFSAPLRIPYLFSSVKDFLFISLPKMSSVLHSPKLLFLVSNLIVVLLIRQSMFFASPSPSRVVFYVDQSPTAMELEKEEKRKQYSEQSMMKVFQVGSEVLTVIGKEVAGGGVGGNELKKRADDFIARVNRQRRLELKLH